VDNAVVVGNAYSLGAEAFIARCVVYGKFEAPSEIVPGSYVIDADLVCRILNLNGFQGAPKDDEEASRRLASVCVMLEKTKT
jgi:hypothetical protein